MFSYSYYKLTILDSSNIRLDQEQYPCLIDPFVTEVMHGILIDPSTMNLGNTIENGMAV